MKSTYQLIKERVKALEEENEYLKFQIECLSNKDKPKDKMLEKLALENEKLQLELDQANSTASMYAKRCIKAIGYIEDAGLSTYEKKLYDILIGEDNDN